MISRVWSGDYPITQPWGCTDLIQEPYWRSAQCHWHCGVDIGMGQSTPLMAARSGIVINISYGLLGIKVGNQTDWYVHIDRAASSVRFGQPVEMGTIVAYSGSKVPAGGYLTGPHLHFEVQAGELNNPATSEDPIAILATTYGGGGSTIPAPLREVATLATSESYIMFGIGDDDYLYASRWDGAKWGLLRIGGDGSLISDFTLSGGGKRIDVYARRKSDHAGVHCHSDDAGASFSGYELLPGLYKSPLQGLGPL